MIEKVKEEILNIVSCCPGINEDRIITILESKKLPWLKGVHYNLIHDIMNSLIANNQIDVVDFLAPSFTKMQNLYFPKGTKITVWD